MMPLYKYHCDKCDKDYTFIEKMTDEHRKSCPKCGEEMKRVYEPVSTVFKSDGFYSKENSSIEEE